MKGMLLRWLASYDDWCEKQGLTAENRHCCVPMNYAEQAEEDDEQTGDRLHDSGARQR